MEIIQPNDHLQSGNNLVAMLNPSTPLALAQLSVNASQDNIRAALDPLFRSKVGGLAPFASPRFVAQTALWMVENDQQGYPALQRRFNIDRVNDVYPEELHAISQQEYRDLVFGVANRVYRATYNVSDCYYHPRKIFRSVDVLKRLADSISPFKQQSYVVLDAANTVHITAEGNILSSPLHPDYFEQEHLFRNRPYSPALSQILSCKEILSSENVNHFPGLVRHELGYRISQQLHDIDQQEENFSEQQVLAVLESRTMKTLPVNEIAQLSIE